MPAAFPVIPFASDLTALGQLGLGTTQAGNQAAYQQGTLQNEFLQNIARNRLAQQQIVQNQQATTLDSAIKMAQLKAQEQAHKEDFANSMALQQQQNAARMAELEKTLSSQERIASSRYGDLTDPRVFQEYLKELSDIEDVNRRAEGVAARANQKLKAESTKFEAADTAKKAEQGFTLRRGYTGKPTIEKERGVLSTEHETAIANILDSFGPDAALVRWNGTEFAPIKRTPPPFPGRRSTAPPTPDVLPTGRPAPSLDVAPLQPPEMSLSPIGGFQPSPLPPGGSSVLPIPAPAGRTTLQTTGITPEALQIKNMQKLVLLDRLKRGLISAADARTELARIEQRFAQ